MKPPKFRGVSVGPLMPGRLELGELSPGLDEAGTIISEQRGALCMAFPDKTDAQEICHNGYYHSGRVSRNSTYVQSFAERRFFNDAVRDLRQDNPEFWHLSRVSKEESSSRVQSSSV